MDSQTKYDKVHTKKYCIKLNLKTDADIIELLDNLDNKQGYIKALIRSNIEDVQGRKNCAVRS